MIHKVKMVLYSSTANIIWLHLSTSYIVSQKHVLKAQPVIQVCTTIDSGVKSADISCFANAINKNMRV